MLVEHKKREVRILLKDAIRDLDRVGYRLPKQAQEMVMEHRLKELLLLLGYSL